MTNQHITKLLELSHLSAVAEIERLTFIEPWSQKSLELLTRDGNLGVAAFEGETPVAYVGLIVCAPEGEITNVATHPDFRRKGYGEAVLKRLEEEARKRGVETLYLEVRSSNLAAQTLYLKLGYEKTGERKGFYKNPKEDAVLMSRALK